MSGKVLSNLFVKFNTSVPQSTELTWGPPELVQHIRLEGEFTSAQERGMS
jgi:hypothetical protein